MARQREEALDDADRNLIRINWPAVHYGEIIVRLKNGEDPKQTERLCVCMISHPDSNDDIVCYSNAGFGKHHGFRRRSFSARDA